MATATASFIRVRADTTTPVGSNPTPPPNCVAGFTNGIGTLSGFELWRSGVMVKRVTMALLTPNQSSLAAFTGPQPGFFINSHNSGSGCGTGAGDGILQWAVAPGTVSTFTIDSTASSVPFDQIRWNMGDTTGSPATVQLLDVNGNVMSAGSTGPWSQASYGTSVTAPQFVQIFVPGDYVPDVAVGAGGGAGKGGSGASVRSSSGTPADALGVASGHATPSWRAFGGYRAGQPASAPTPTRRQPPAVDRDDVSVIVGGRRIAGWTDVRITRGIERVPSDFELSYTEPPDLRGLAMLIHPGDPCEVRIGSDLVVTGYIDRVMPSIAPGVHRITALGRGKCQDLVDCSANYRGGLIRSSTVDDIATILAFPFGIGIETRGDMGGVIPAFNIAHGQTPFEVIENICRFRQLLAFELANGNLMLTREFTTTAASGFAEGVNITSGAATWAMDQRYSDYWVYLQSLDALQELNDTGSLVGKCSDRGVPRFRLRKIVTETSGAESAFAFAEDRATWEAARRAGRSAEIRLTVDSWRDAKGDLFEPGMLVDIDAPSLYMTSGPQDLNSRFVIGELTYRRGDGGTTLDVVAMSPLAFVPQPTVLARGVSRDILNLPPGLAKQ